MTVAFVPLLVGGALLPLPTEGGGLTAAMPAAVNLAPIVVWTIVFMLGIMIADPFAVDLIPLLGRERRTGTYYGVYFSVAGLGVLVGNPVTACSSTSPAPWLFPACRGCSQSPSGWAARC
ncbi:MAG: hypothetical protein ACRDS0_15990 [Pseudonocardiaceae bacterium]